MKTYLSRRAFADCRYRAFGALAALALWCVSLSGCADYAPRPRPDLPQARYYSHPFNPGKAGSTASFEAEVQYCVSHDLDIRVFVSADQYKEIVKSLPRTVNGVKVYPYPTSYVVPLVWLRVTSLRDGKVLLERTVEAYRLKSGGDKAASFYLSGLLLEPGIHRVEAKAMRDAPMFDKDTNQIELSIYWNMDLKGQQKCTN